jgi:hypothetical protein
MEQLAQCPPNLGYSFPIRWDWLEPDDIFSSELRIFIVGVRNSDEQLTANPRAPLGKLSRTEK